MNCSKPITLNGGVFACGQCIPCRVNKRRVWTHRILLESSMYEDNAFLTLTFDDDHYPEDHSVNPKDVSLFMKRLRKQCDQKLRYFAVGEYGDCTFRPHYHIALFNYPACKRGISRFSQVTGKCCAQCDMVLAAWGYGQITSGRLEPQSAAYVAGYVMKKMTRDDDIRLEGRRPEFARMSLRPGLGLGMMHDLASVILTENLEDRMIDVPLSLQHGKRKFPLGRYLRRKLRTFIGRDEKTPQIAKDLQREEMQPMRDAAFAASKPFTTEILKHSLGKRIQIEATYKRKRKRGSV